MASFEDREKGFERKFAHDEELKFKATARRNRLLGLWAAGQMGLSGDDAQNYAREVIKADLEEPGEEDVFRKIRRDFDAKGVSQSDHQIRRQMRITHSTADKRCKRVQLFQKLFFNPVHATWQSMTGLAVLFEFPVVVRQRRKEASSD